jgi:hypothetical protein
VITNPASGVTLLLDHVKMEVRALPAPPGVTPPQVKPPAVPGMPGAPTPPTTPAVAVKDLGIKLVQGIEVQGKQYTLPPLTPPKPPAAPGMPGGPAIPGAPASPAVPKPPQLPMVAETWISTKLQMPVLCRITGSFGQQMCHCKNTVAGEPPLSTFQIPPGYKQVGVPAAPAPPAPPAAPGMPAAPKMPAAPAMPAAPKTPAAPAMPAAPKPPKFSF